MKKELPFISTKECSRQRKGGGGRQSRGGLCCRTIFHTLRARTANIPLQRKRTKRTGEPLLPSEKLAVRHLGVYVRGVKVCRRKMKSGVKGESKLEKGTY